MSGMTKQEIAIKKLTEIYDEAYDRWVHRQYIPDKLVTLIRDGIPDVLAPLREQEAVKPREYQYPHGTYACGFCDYIPIGNKDGYRANYCPECGKAVKWDE